MKLRYKRYAPATLSLKTKWIRGWSGPKSRPDGETCCYYVSNLTVYQAIAHFTGGLET
jgi:hypothetical protein